MKIYSSILNRDQRSKLLLLSVFLLIGMLFEVLSLGVLLPLIAIIVSRSEDNIYYSNLIEIFNYFNLKEELILPILSAIIILVYTIKSLYLIYLNYRKNRFISNLVKSVSNKLFKSKIYNDYSEHVKKNSAEAIKNLQVDLSGLYIHIESYLSIIIESFLAVSIIAFVIFLEPFTFLLSIMFFGLISMIYYNLIKSRMTRYGYANLDLEVERNKLILESFHGLKDIKILNISKSYIDDFEKNAEKTANIKTRYSTIVQFPRFIFETLAIYGLFFIMAILLFYEKDSQEIIEIIGIFSVAIFKLIPSINKLMQNFQNLKYSLPSIESINEGLSKPILQKEKYSLIDMKKELEIKNLSFAHNNKPLLLDNVNLKIKKGEIIGISGESGSGKSTLVDILLGIYSPEKGSILLDGKKINFGELSIGYVPQKVFIKNASLKENIAFGEKIDKIDKDDLKYSIEMAQLSEFIISLNERENTVVGEHGLMISGGQLQRIGIARALYKKPEILILDESTSSLDQETEKLFFKYLKSLKGKITMIIITHNLKNLKICDSTYTLVNKKLIELK